MSRWLAGLGTVILAAIVLWGVLAPAPTADDRVQTLGDRIRCPVCNGESIADSPAATARQMLAIVEERVADGASDDEVIAFFTDRYGQAILLDPPFSGLTLALWLIPLAGLGGGIWVVLHNRRSSGALDDGDADDTADAESRELESSGTASRGLQTVFAVGVAVVAVGTLAALALQPRNGGPVSGATVGEEVDLATISNEQMEAVIAANLDNPQVAGMRMALADRYFAERDFSSALPHYFSILQGDASSRQASVALARLGWMTWESAGTAELETAQAYLDRALAEDQSNLEAQLFKGLIVLYGTEDCVGSLPYLEGVAGDASVVGQARQLAETAIDDANSGLGGRCA